MRKNYLNAGKALFGVFVAAFLMPGNSAAQSTQTFSYTGSVQNFTVPTCVGTITVEARGAQGATGAAVGGNGGTAIGVMQVTPGQVLSIYVGGQNGYNGGGTGNVTSGGNGGGASDVRFSPYALANRAIVGAGGGGGGGTNSSQTTAGGGIGGGGTSGSNYSGGTAGYAFAGLMGTNGGLTGGAGGTGNGSNRGGSGGGGGYTSGGGGGNNSPLMSGTNGTIGIGGNAGGAGGAGGGGGYYGGGGSSEGSNSNSGGGGGSSYTGTLTSPSFTGGNQTGNGLVIFTYNLTGVNISASANPSVICTGGTATLTANSMVTYTWSTGSNASSITVSPTTNTSYTVSGTNSCGFSSSVVVTASVNTAAPTLTISGSTNSVCLGQTVALTASGAASYTWTGGISNGMTFTPSATTSYTVSGSNACGVTSSVTTVTVSALPVFINATSTLICAGTPATLTAGGATTYTWMPGTSTQTSYIVNPTANTVYTVTGTTGNCQGTNTISISTKANPTVTIVPTSTAICEGDVVSLTANGALTYTWNPVVSSNTTIAASPTVATLYSVIGTNSNNCTASASQVVLVRPKPAVNATASDDLVCVGGASTLTASGANTYLWSNNAGTTVTVVNPTQTTTYSVTGTSTAGCVSTTVVTVSVFDPTLTVSSATAICRGTAVNLSAGGMDSYVWSTGSVFSSITVSPAVTTTYSVEGSSTQSVVTCTAHASVLVTVNPNPTVTAAGSPTAGICKGESAVLTAGGAATYTWAGGTPAVSQSFTVTPAADQTYTVAGADANGCKGTATILLKVYACVGIRNNGATAASLVIYPNPSNGDFTISADQDIDLQIINELGQLVKTVTLNGTTTEVKINSLSSGIYFITGKNENGSVKQKLLITK